MTAANPNSKSVIYVDIDDEITGIIDKVNAADGRVVALVLPKRATVFQSIVNMKLLKRRADAAKKHLVLITSEVSLLPLAGSVGVYVAKTLQSKPEIPTAPPTSDLPEDIEEESMALPNDDFDTSKAGAKPVGELAGAAGASALDPDETIQLDDEPDSKGLRNPLMPAASSAATPVATKNAAKSAGKNGKKKLSIPNFEKFRLRLILGALLLIVLIAGWIVCFKVLPKATVDISTNASDVNSSLDLNLNTAANSLGTSQNTVPAQTQQVQKTYTQQATASGQKNKGNKASGTVTMTAKKCSGNPFAAPNDVPAGTGISANGLTFITQQTVSFQGSGTDGSGCFVYSSGGTSITAQQGGSSYNLDSTDFDVAGRSDVSANGSTSGGTDNIVKVVQQSDIDGAKQKLSSSQDSSSIKKQLEEALQNDSLFAVKSTYNTGKPTITTSANVGDTADNVTVTENITYTMFGVKKSDLQKLLDNDVKKQIDTSKQGILDDGLDQASFDVSSTPSATQVQVALQATSTVGPKLDQDKLKQQIAGEKSGDVKDAIKSIPGVKDVTIHYSPFWVSSMPKNVNKITLEFEKPASSKSNADN